MSRGSEFFTLATGWVGEYGVANSGVCPERRMSYGTTLRTLGARTISDLAHAVGGCEAMSSGSREMEVYAGATQPDTKVPGRSEASAGPGNLPDPYSMIARKHARDDSMSSFRAALESFGLPERRGTD